MKHAHPALYDLWLAMDALALKHEGKSTKGTSPEMLARQHLESARSHLGWNNVRSAAAPDEPDQDGAMRALILAVEALIDDGNGARVHLSRAAECIDGKARAA